MYFDCLRNLMIFVSRYGMMFGYKYVKGIVKFFVDYLKVIMVWFLNWLVFFNFFVFEFLMVLLCMCCSVNVYLSLIFEYVRFF